MGQHFNGGGDSEHLPSLPAFDRLASQSVTAKERATVALRLLRQAAVISRKSKGCPFYSIRAVAKHFSLPPTTVTRLYGQLKTEGILGSIWGSKTIIEPVDIDKDIRLKAVVGLPVSLTEFSLIPGHRKFFRLIQHTLWKQRFGSQLVFYENGFGESSKFADSLLEYKADVVIWLTPSSRRSNTVARLRDRGVRLITIADRMPINGESGYYISRRDALVEGLAGWKTAGIRSVIIVHEHECTRVSTQRMLHNVLTELGILPSSHKLGLANSSELPVCNRRNSGVIFPSAQSVLQFVHKGVADFSTLCRENRVMFLEGVVDLPEGMHLAGLFDTIEFDWRIIARRIVSDLIANRCTNGVQEQTVFKAKWCPGIDTGIVRYARQ
jgi:DNA-binding transcriptional regulator YhcF (GntR family)